MVNITDYIARKRFERRIRADIDLVLSACLPLDWTETIGPEPALATGCVHPIERVAAVAAANGYRFFCAACRADLTREQVQERWPV